MAVESGHGEKQILNGVKGKVVLIAGTVGGQGVGKARLLAQVGEKAF
jgi:predicted ATP-dependent serine protease